MHIENSNKNKIVTPSAELITEIGDMWREFEAARLDRFFDNEEYRKLTVAGLEHFKSQSLRDEVEQGLDSHIERLKGQVHIFITDENGEPDPEAAGRIQELAEEFLGSTLEDYAARELSDIREGLETLAGQVSGQDDEALNQGSYMAAVLDYPFQLEDCVDPTFIDGRAVLEQDFAEGGTKSTWDRLIDVTQPYFDFTNPCREMLYLMGQEVERANIPYDVETEEAAFSLIRHLRPLALRQVFANAESYVDYVVQRVLLENELLDKTAAVMDTGGQATRGITVSHDPNELLERFEEFTLRLYREQAEADAALAFG